MGLLVLDCSVTMAWLFREELTPFTERVLDEVTAGRAVVPSLWPLEVGNVLLLAERRGRVSEADGARFLALLGGLRIEVDGAERPVTEDVGDRLAREAAAQKGL